MVVSAAASALRRLTWPTGYPTDSIDLRATALIDLVEGRLEIEGDAWGPDTAWPPVGPALLAHATSSLRSIVFQLQSVGAHNDASRLLRSLYDHVVTFAWLAVDPPARLAPWRKEDLKERLKIHREFAAVGEQLLSDADREQMERDVARIEEHSLRSFRGFYTTLFREQSGLVPATMRG